MCGVVGHLDLTHQSAIHELQCAITRMADTLVHRGPDDSGVWLDPRSGIALSHRRLAILDLSNEGSQPMHSPSQRYVIAYNGEVYNFQALRRKLEGLGQNFRGHSDTEVILTAIDTWGLKAATTQFVGMFAFALWDCQERRLSLVRDRLGIKPLYYGRVNGAFVFGSELKAIRAFPGFKQPVDRGALALLMRHNYVPAPYSIYQDIYKLLPGHILTLDGDDPAGQPEIKAYWSAKEVAESGVASPFEGSDAQAIEALDKLLRNAVGIRMVSDVPLGAFLSGGYDSSLVVAQMQAQSSRPIKTFSIGFHEKQFNEANHAKAVAAHLGCDHTEFYVTPKEAMDVIPRLPTLYDEPFSDSSQIPTFLVSQLARQDVTVSLSGDGGDELFSGYNRYTWGKNIWNKVSCLPIVARKWMSIALKSVSPQCWDRVFENLGPILPPNLKQRMPGDRLHKLAEILTVKSSDAMYHALISHWKDPASMITGANEPKTALTDRSRWANLGDLTQRMMYLDTVSYLPDDILTKVDRASMGVSLEARIPLLDHRIVEFSWRLPLSMKLRDGQGKWILRQVLYKYVPRKLVDRPKMGFGVPIDTWLRGPLREWAESLLDEKRLIHEGFFRPKQIRQKWAEHLSGSRNWQYHLWDVLMFQAWLEEQ